MSHLEDEFRTYLAKHPEIAKCYNAKMINTRSLTRNLIQNKVGSADQFDAIVSMIRRHNFQAISTETVDFSPVRVHTKDAITIVSFEKSKDLLQDIEDIIKTINYDTNETFKVVIGSSAITLFIDTQKAKTLRHLEKKYNVINTSPNVSEISILFSHKSVSTPGTLAMLTQEIALHNIIIEEVITSTAELLLYVSPEHVMKTYNVIKSLSSKS